MGDLYVAALVAFGAAFGAFVGMYTAHQMNPPNNPLNIERALSMIQSPTGDGVKSGRAAQDAALKNLALQHLQMAQQILLVVKSNHLLETTASLDDTSRQGRSTDGQVPLAAALRRVRTAIDVLKEDLQSTGKKDNVVRLDKSVKGQTRLSADGVASSITSPDSFYSAASDEDEPAMGDGSMPDLNGHPMSTEVLGDQEVPGASVGPAMKESEPIHVAGLEAKLATETEIMELTEVDIKLWHHARMAEEQQQIRVRLVRHEMVQVESAEIYRIKVFCQRRAYTHMLSNPERSKRLVDTLMRVCKDLLLVLGQSTGAFEQRMKELLLFCAYDKQRNFTNMVNELMKSKRNLSEITFYDVCIDFILLDAFHDLANPPDAVMAVLGNTWIPVSVKKAGVSRAIYSVISGKSSMVNDKAGFMSHFYRLTLTLTPHLSAAALCGDAATAGPVKMFIEEMTQCVRDTFNSDVVDYSTTETLADTMYERILQLEKVHLLHNS
eukprot:Clim_evm67s134 gene=Clim_evmTU67s134